MWLYTWLRVLWLFFSLWLPKDTEITHKPFPFFLLLRKSVCIELKNRNRDVKNQASMQIGWRKAHSCIFSSGAKLLVLWCLAGQSRSWFTWPLSFAAAASLSWLFHSDGKWIWCSPILHMDHVVVGEAFEVAENAVRNYISSGNARGERDAGDLVRR